MATVRVGLGEHDDVQVVDDLDDLRRVEAHPALGDPAAGAVGVGEQLHEVDQDVRAAPLASVHAAEEADTDGGGRSVVDADRATGPPLPRDVRQRDQLGESRVRRARDGLQGRFHLGDVEVARLRVLRRPGREPIPRSDVPEALLSGLVDVVVPVHPVPRSANVCAYTRTPWTRTMSAMAARSAPCTVMWNVATTPSVLGDQRPSPEDRTDTCDTTGALPGAVMMPRGASGGEPVA